MFEFDQYEPERRVQPRLTPPPDLATAADIAELSFMVWGEHCIECAEPGCYQSCGLYQARPDGRCRRFAYGIYRNRDFAGLRGYGAEITFKTWGKLEAEGNALMEPRRTVLRRERLIAWGGGPLRTMATLASSGVGVDGWRDWPPPPRKIARRLHRHVSPAHLPDAFRIDVFNPSDRPVPLQLTMRVVADNSASHGASGPSRMPPPYLDRFELPPGLSRFHVDATRFHHILTCGRRFKISVMPEAEQSITLVFLALDFVRMRALGAGHVNDATPTADAAARPAVKCVVFDLDNTLWHGILAEGGGLALRTGVIDLFRHLDSRGILISIASKNDHASAWAKLESFGLADYVLHPRIGWGAKSASVRAIAGALDIGLDTFMFVDDSPFERAEVTQALPDVACHDAADLEALIIHPRLQGSGSGEAGRRRAFYREALQRDQARHAWSDDYLGFLRACNIELTIRPYRTGDFERVSELVQRTNQLNFSGRKYTAADLLQRLADPGLDKIVLACRDRYGDYGTVGFALVARTGGEVRVDDLMLSCRVQGRTIEAALFRWLWDGMAPAVHRSLWVRLTPTRRNGPARQVLEDMGLQPDPAGTGYRFSGDRRFDVPAVIAVDDGGAGRGGNHAAMPSVSDGDPVCRPMTDS
ncbi:MAG: HAD-IIIC family phosphatase [Rhodospirillales bacterium]|nr:MAG: HAD-IIIC family phosphatase [Rhodospirillales bacterium]